MAFNSSGVQPSSGMSWSKMIVSIITKKDEMLNKEFHQLFIQQLVCMN